MNVTLKDAEIACVKKLAELYAEGKVEWSGNEGWADVGLSDENYSQVLGMMESIGAISAVSHAMGAPFFFFNIDVKAVQIAREIEHQEAKSQERKDIVELVKLTLRKHPFTAWAFLIGVGLLGLLAAANQVISFLQNIGAMTK
jgi:hypothetical protein